MSRPTLTSLMSPRSSCRRSSRLTKCWVSAGSYRLPSSSAACAISSARCVADGAAWPTVWQNACRASLRWRQRSSRIRARLTAAPVATLLERRCDPQTLMAFGYALLAAGLIGNGFMEPSDDFWPLAWQQAARGFAFGTMPTGRMKSARSALPLIQASRRINGGRLTEK
jgi:hypothetical protein